MEQDLKPGDHELKFSSLSSKMSPGGLVVKNLPSKDGDTGSVPGGGSKIPQAAGQLSLSATNEPVFSGTCVQELERGLRAATESPQQSSSVPQLGPDAAKETFKNKKNPKCHHQSHQSWGNFSLFFRCCLFFLKYVLLTYS